MNTRAIVRWVLVAVGLCVQTAVTHASAQTKPAEPALRRFALVASSNDGGASRARLRFADSDARAVADVLRHLGGLRAEDLVLLPGARRASLRASFEVLKASIAKTPKGGPRREVFVYYSGHSDETGLLLGGEHVSYQDLRQWLEATDADVRIAILDSCASGALIRKRGGVRRPSFLSDVSVNARGHAFLTASSASEAAQESDRIGAAFFTHYLVSGLRGAADSNRDGRVTLAEAYQFAYSETLGRTQQTVGGPQHPAYDIQLAGTGDLVLTDLQTTSARLVLAQDIVGRVYVRDASGRLVVELRKEPLYPVELGLAAGEYRVSIDRDGRHFDAAVSLEHGKVARVSSHQLSSTQPLATTARGTEAQAAPSKTEKTTASDDLIGETSLLGQTREIGGYAGLDFRYTRLAGGDAFLAGIEGALLLNRRYAIGLTAAGGISGNGDYGKLTIGYAGFVARYHFVFESPLGLSLGMLASGGAVSQSDQDYGDALFLFEPQLGGHLDLTRFARVGIDFGYRLAAGADRYAASDLHGFTGGFHVRLGWL